jgi:hypothetical protein|tara:strand:- start:13365 stop:13601 length:237 start_codon:yes stop_codon:yes gene_type:complete
MKKENNKSIYKENPTLLTKKALYKVYNNLLKEGKISENGAAHQRMEQIGLSMNMRKKWADIRKKIFNSDLVGSSIVKN